MSDRCAPTANELSREASGPELAPSVTAWRAHRISGAEGETGRTINLTTTAARDPTRTSRVDARLLPVCHGPSKCRLEQ
jgi:hypothetical protein